MNQAKSFIAAVLAALLLTVGYICQLKNFEAARITEQLNAYEAQVQRVLHHGRGNYYSFVVLNVNGKKVPSTLDTKAGDVGSTVTVWSSPNFSISYSHKTQLQERARRTWIVFFFLLLVFTMIFVAMFSKSGTKPRSIKLLS